MINTTVMVTEEMNRRIAEYCVEYKCTRSEAIRQLIALGIESWLGE